MDDLLPVSKPVHTREEKRLTPARCKNPATKTRLIDQLRAVFSGDPIAKHPLPFTQLNRVPLLECTDTECLRLHPPIGYAIPRRTPSQSAVICGVYIPGGVAVGVPAATLGRNADVYANPDVWDPDRWSDKRADLATMRTSFLGFGHGSRQGMGRIVAMQDITKTVATLLLRYEVELEDAELELGTKEFTIQNPDKPYRVVLRHRAA